MGVTAGSNRIPTFGTWSTASSFLGATFDFGFEASTIMISSLDAGIVQFSLGSTQIAASTANGPTPITTSSGVFYGLQQGVVACGETVTVDGAGVTSMLSVAMCTTGRMLRVMAFGR
jgi:hypothetical protein